LAETTRTGTRGQISKLLAEASKETQATTTAVFKIERDKLYQARPIGVTQEIVHAIKDIVK
jgi:hypothetical protein